MPSCTIESGSVEEDEYREGRSGGEGLCDGEGVGKRDDEMESGVRGGEIKTFGLYIGI